MMENPGAAHFVIDGGTYEVPAFDTFTMGETIVLYEYSGITVDAIDDDTQVPPGFIAGLMHIAYQRSNPAVKKTKVRELIEGSNLAEALEKFQDAQEAAVDPPEEPQKTEPGSPATSGVSEPSSGANGMSTSGSHPASSSPIISGTPV